MPKSGYFQQVSMQTPTRLWINNPSGPEMEQAIAAGAINCTTNPAYCSKLLDGEPAYLRDLIDRVIQETRDHPLATTGDYCDAAAARVYQLASQRVMERFRPLFESSNGRIGYVTVQDDPRADEDADSVIRAARQNRTLGRNFMAKIPVIAAGLKAIEACVAEDIPICATEVFSIAQAISVCELYEQAVKKTGKRPPFYVTHITGIFDEYMGKVAQRDGIRIAPEVLAQAGCAVGRKEYRLLKERGYQTTLLGGGARGTRHFTEFVGGDIHITINWSTAQELIEVDGPVVNRMDVETPQAVIDELTEKFDDFRLAYDEGALPVEQYADYGPVQLFRNAFLKGWYLLLAEVASRRNFNAL
jgi:transaldolase